MDLEPSFESGSAKNSYARTRSSRRFEYEAEVQVIKKHIGDLETIRARLGLSQRKICQLLLVDPSAWSRWLKTGQVPPHIYRALSWYLSQVEKSPLDHRGNYEELKTKIQTLFVELSSAHRQIQDLKSRYRFSLYAISGLLFIFGILKAFYKY